jgi:hypothetical protein
MIDAAKFMAQWELAKQVVSNAKKSGSVMAQLWRGRLNAGKVDSSSEVKKLVCIRLVYPYNTACCERGFSLMILIKIALRNRLYIETLDALMTICILGKRYIQTGAMGAKEFFESALSVWEASCLRNPNMARFGNNNAKGKGKVETMTEIPPSGDNGSG